MSTSHLYLREWGRGGGAGAGRDYLLAGPLGSHPFGPLRQGRSAAGAGPQLYRNAGLVLISLPPPQFQMCDLKDTLPSRPVSLGFSTDSFWGLMAISIPLSLSSFIKQV